MDDEKDMIKPRGFILKLTDEECEDLSIKAGSVGLTVGELLQNFISDLTGGERANGSDERSYANSWFQRSIVVLETGYSFLQYLLEAFGGGTPENYLEILDDMEASKRSIDEIKEKIAHPEDEWRNIVHSDGSPCFNSMEEYLEEERACLSAYEDDFAWYKEKLDEMWNDYLEEFKNQVKYGFPLLESEIPDRQEELKKIMFWYDEQQAIMQPDQNEKSEQRNNLKKELSI